MSASCPSCMYIKSTLPILQNCGFRIIALDDYLTPCVRDLLWALHVTSFPAIQHDGLLRCGSDAVLWLTKENRMDCIDALGTTIAELQILLLLTKSNKNTNSISQDPGSLLLSLRNKTN